MSIGSSVFASPASYDWEALNPFSGTYTPNSVDQQLPMNTSGRRTLELTGRSLNLEPVLSEETARQIGRMYGSPLWMAGSNGSLHRYECPVTPHSQESQRTISNQLPWNAQSMCTLEEPDWASRVVRGPRLAGPLILRTPTPNSGMAIRARSMSSWMSSEERLTSAISSDGQIDTPCPLRQREVDVFSAQRSFGSLPMYIPDYGILTSTKKLKTL